MKAPAPSRLGGLPRREAVGEPQTAFATGGAT